MFGLLWFRCVYNAQGQIIVLAALISNTETADCLNQRPSVNPQVIDKIMPKHQSLIVICFEIGVAANVVLVDVILVCIDEIKFRIIVQA